MAKGTNREDSSSSREQPIGARSSPWAECVMWTARRLRKGRHVVAVWVVRRVGGVWGNENWLTACRIKRINLNRRDTYPCRIYNAACARNRTVRVYFLSQQLSLQKTENKTGYPFAVLKPTQASGFSCSVHQQREKRAFRT